MIAPSRVSFLKDLFFLNYMCDVDFYVGMCSWVQVSMDARGIRSPGVISSCKLPEVHAGD